MEKERALCKYPPKDPNISIFDGLFQYLIDGNLLKNFGIRGESEVDATIWEQYRPIVRLLLRHSEQFVLDLLNDLAKGCSCHILDVIIDLLVS